MRKANPVLVEKNIPPVNAVLEPTERTTERQGFTFFISKSSMKIDSYNIVISDGDMALSAEVVGRDKLIEFISAFDE